MQCIILLARNKTFCRKSKSISCNSLNSLSLNGSLEEKKKNPDFEKCVPATPELFQKVSGGCCTLLAPRRKKKLPFPFLGLKNWPVFWIEKIAYIVNSCFVLKGVSLHSDTIALIKKSNECMSLIPSAPDVCQFHRGTVFHILKCVVVFHVVVDNCWW